jgi:hypothetical protein
MYDGGFWTRPPAGRIAAGRIAAWGVIVRGAAACGLVFAAVLFGSCQKAETRKAFFFYEVVCPSCEESKAQEALAGQAVYWAGKQKRMEIQTFDVFHTSGGMETLTRLFEKYKIDPYSVSLPVLFVDDVMYSGHEAIRAVVDDAK